MPRAHCAAPCLALREHIFRVGESPLDFVLVGPSIEHHFVAESEVLIRVSAAAFVLRC